MKHDLFPETLLVNIADGHTFTTSLKVAEHFSKRHKDVLRAISKLDCSDAFRERNFAPTIRQIPGPKNSVRSEPMYQLTRDGFAFLAMGFTGKEAARWKEAFLDAFNQMEAQLRAQTEREALALYSLRPKWRLIAQGLAQKLSRTQICQQTGHRSPDSITANKRRMREVGLLTH